MTGVEIVPTVLHRSERSRINQWEGVLLFMVPPQSFATVM